MKKLTRDWTVVKVRLGTFDDFVYLVLPDAGQELNGADSVESQFLEELQSTMNLVFGTEVGKQDPQSGPVLYGRRTSLGLILNG